MKQWKKENKQDAAELNFIIKHSLRTLIKNGNTQALAMLGIGDANGVALYDVKYNKSVRLDEYLVFDFKLSCSTAKPILIDYLIYFKTKNNTWNSKVFKLKNFEAVKDKEYLVTKKHKFLANSSTRNLNLGTHKAAIQINGSVLATFNFELIKA